MRHRRNVESNMIERLKALVDQRTEKALIEAEDILLRYLESNRDDIEGWLLLTRIEWNSPLQDPFRIIEYPKKGLVIKTSPFAVIVILDRESLLDASLIHPSFFLHRRYYDNYPQGVQLSAA